VSGNPEAGCIFCAILDGRAEASFVHRDELCSAFMTIEPVNAGHVLVVPNAHADNLLDMPPATAARMMQVAQKVAAAFFPAGLGGEGFNLMMCNGEAAGQTVFHAHLHVSPRHAGDGFSWTLPAHCAQPPAREQLDALALRLRRVLEMAPDAAPATAANLDS